MDDTSTAHRLSEDVILVELVPTAGFHIDQGDLSRLIEACKYASDQLAQVVNSLRFHSRNGQEWAQDAVSRDVAAYYEDQVYQSTQSTYAALVAQRDELFSTTTTLQQILIGYNTTDAEAAESMELS
jgi:hypothetical protein